MMSSSACVDVDFLGILLCRSPQPCCGLFVPLGTSTASLDDPFSGHLLALSASLTLGCRIVVPDRTSEIHRFLLCRHGNRCGALLFVYIFSLFSSLRWASFCVWLVLLVLSFADTDVGVHLFCLVVLTRWCMYSVGLAYSRRLLCLFLSSGCFRFGCDPRGLFGSMSLLGLMVWRLCYHGGVNMYSRCCLFVGCLLKQVVRGSWCWLFADLFYLWSCDGFTFHVLWGALILFEDCHSWGLDLDRAGLCAYIPRQLVWRALIQCVDHLLLDWCRANPSTKLVILTYFVFVVLSFFGSFASPTAAHCLVICSLLVPMCSTFVAFAYCSSCEYIALYNYLVVCNSLL